MPASGRPETASRSPHPIAISHSYSNPLPFNLRKPSLLVLAALAACLAASTAGGEGLASRLAVGDCLTGSDWGTPRQSLAPAVLSLVNAHRSALGLSQLRSSPTLTSSALWKARHMAKYGYFAHDDPAPPVARTAFDRIAACGYPGNEVGENIAVGYRTPAAVMQAWLQSPGHRANRRSCSPALRRCANGAAGSQPSISSSERRDRTAARAEASGRCAGTRRSRCNRGWRGR